MKKLAHRTRTIPAGLAGLIMVSSGSLAAAPSAADRAWIDKCVADRKHERLHGSSLGEYCVCIRDVVEDNRSFGGIVEVERAYSPAHASCG